MVVVEELIVYADVSYIFSYASFLFSSFMIGIYFVHPLLLSILVLLAVVLDVALLVV